MNKEMRTFITGSHYRGDMIKRLEIMDGFGVYTYPHGIAKYRGYFRNGKFHGYGILKIYNPKSFELRGRFDHGVMVHITEMCFSDGLRVKCNQSENNKLQFDDWVYCTGNERRFSTELSIGLQPVGPNSLVTKERSARYVGADCYDTEEGIFHTHTGFVLQIPKPFPNTRFVSCKKEENWVKEHCRKGPTASGVVSDIAPIEPSAELCRRIIKNNIDGTPEINSSCGCYHHRAQTNTHTILRDEDSDALTQTQTQESCSSFNDVYVVQDLTRKLQMEVFNLAVDEVDTSYTNRDLMRHRPSHHYITTTDPE